ncbi:MAG: glycosyl transferase family 1, partial [Bacteroidetes bacterium]|nr:glycosyl transferase family 1 [Bacteroidota bacterium]
MNDAFRRVLIIAYYFPPMGLSGVQRTVKFAKFLPKFGWKPTVL